MMLYSLTVSHVDSAITHSLTFTIRLTVVDKGQSYGAADIH